MFIATGVVGCLARSLKTKNVIFIRFDSIKVINGGKRYGTDDRKREILVDMGLHGFMVRFLYLHELRVERGVKLTIMLELFKKPMTIQYGFMDMVNT